MRTAEQFMRDFLSESESLHRRYHDGPPLKQEIESISTLSSFAFAITNVVGINLRMRYRLRPAKESWMIEHKDTPCGACRGTGKNRGTDETCPKCEGACWIGFK
jgi:hypothetical protein